MNKKKNKNKNKGSTYILSALGPYFANWTVISRPSTILPETVTRLFHSKSNQTKQTKS